MARRAADRGAEGTAEDREAVALWRRESPTRRSAITANTIAITAMSAGMTNKPRATTW